MDRRQILELSASLPLAASLLGAAAPAMAAEGPGASVRMAIQDTLNQFIWGFDNGDVTMAAGAFTRNATVRDINGKLWGSADGGAPGFLKAAMRTPGEAGAHYIQTNSIVPKGSGFVAVTYWSRITWPAAAPAPALRGLGTYTDTFVRDGQMLRIAERVVARWDSSTVQVNKL